LKNFATIKELKAASPGGIDITIISDLRNAIKGNEIKNEKTILNTSDIIFDNVIRGIMLIILIPFQLVNPALLILLKEKAPTIITSFPLSFRNFAKKLILTHAALGVGNGRWVIKSTFNLTEQKYF
jgi:hypothetical protein